MSLPKMSAKILSALLLGGVAAITLSIPAALAADKTILMVEWKEGMETDTVFKSKLTELGIKATFKEINANQDRGVLASALRDLEADIGKKTYDAIYTYGTVGTQLTTSVVRNQVPVVFNIVFDPVAAKLVESKDKPGQAVTGVTNGVPVGEQLDTFKTLKPIKRLLVLYNVREPNSVQIEKDVTQWAEKNGVTLVSSRVAPGTDSVKEILADVTSGKVQVDSVYAGADNYLASVAKDIQAGIGDKVALYGGTQTYVAAGWLGAYAPLNSDMGAAAAQQMAKILNGANPATLPVILPQPKLFVSKAAAAKHGITPPATAQLQN